jgi:hypothetical protein
MFLSGESKISISRKLNCHYKTVLYHTKGYGIPKIINWDGKIYPMGDKKPNIKRIQYCNVGRKVGTFNISFVDFPKKCHIILKNELTISYKDGKIYFKERKGGTRVWK